jgi:hypothetical protein
MRDEDDIQFEQRRARERAKEAAPIVWALVYAAATVRSSDNAKNAASEADKARGAFEQRFCQEPPSNE